MTRFRAWLRTPKKIPTNGQALVTSVIVGVINGVVKGIEQSRRDEKILALEVRIAALERRPEASGRYGNPKFGNG